MPRVIRKSLTAFLLTFSVLTMTPSVGLAQSEAAQDRPVIRRAIPQGLRNRALQFVRTELFFGTAKPIGAVTEEEFQAFLDAEITPRFPDGLTLTKARGQFRGEDGNVIKEDSYVLILLYPLESAKDGNKKIEAIRRLYLEQFQQESVLRVDDPFTVRVSF